MLSSRRCLRGFHPRWSPCGPPWRIASLPGRTPMSVERYGGQMELKCGCAITPPFRTGSSTRNGTRRANGSRRRRRATTRSKRCSREVGMAARLPADVLRQAGTAHARPLTFREHAGNTGGRLLKEPATDSLRTTRESSPILTECPTWPPPPAELHPFAPHSSATLSALPA